MRAFPRRRVFQQSRRPSDRSEPGASRPHYPILALLGFVGLCLLVGTVGGLITAGSVRTWYPSLTAPPGTPPNWVFGPVWTTLYVLMGVAAWRVWLRAGPSGALRLWGWQLAANAVWTPVFFGLHSPRFALMILLSLLVLLGLTIWTFRRVDVWAAAMLLPYLGWSVYATWLNAGFWWLNPV